MVVCEMNYLGISYVENGYSQYSQIADTFQQLNEAKENYKWNQIR